MPIGPSTGTGIFSASLAKSLSDMRKQFGDLQVQLSTGQKSQDFAGLGSGRSISLALRGRLSNINTFRTSIQTVNLRVDLMSTNIKRMGDLGREAKADTDPASFNLATEGQTTGQQSTQLRLEEAVDLLNANLGGRYLFSGRQTSVQPVEDVSKIMEGDGTRDGFEQIVLERRAADLGANGLGRLDTPTVTADTVTLAEDGTHPFGFKLAAATPSTAWATVTGPTGAPPSMDIQVATQPTEGQSLRLSLNLPDGTTKEIRLTATTSTNPGDFSFTIGADANATAANLRDVIQNNLSTAAQTSLRAASAVAASEDFFNIDGTRLPQRVNGAPPETSTALVDATSTNTVAWYKGDGATDDPRSSVTARIDTSVSARYGARANEEALRKTMQYMAAYAGVTFDANDPNAAGFHQELATRTRNLLNGDPSKPSPDTMLVEFGTISSQLDSTDERHVHSSGVITTTLAGEEGVDTQDVAAKILTLQTRLQASYQTTAILSDLRLVNYL